MTWDSLEQSSRPQTPPRGWNSWDSFGTAVTEAEVVANAEFIAEHLLAFGWDTVVVDIQWYEPNARAGGYNDDADIVLDAFGRPQPAVNRFPSSAGGAGFAPLAALVHALGLKFGLHIMRGIPRRAVAAALPIEGSSLSAADIADYSRPCSWNSDNWGIDFQKPGADAYYRSLAGLFGSWGVDFVKADDMLWPYHAAEISSLASALRKVNPATVLSLSPGVDVSTEYVDHLRENSTMWRISNDLWDDWDDVLDQFQRMARWAPLSRPGAWADADMLPLGHIGIRAERGSDRQSSLTAEEQRSLMTLWSISGSPLFVGGDLPTSSQETIQLLTNRLMLDVNARRDSPRELLRELNYVVWTATLDDLPIVGVFNIGDEPLTREIRLDSLGLVGEFDIEEAWTAATGSSTVAVPIDLAPHDAALYRLRPR